MNDALARISALAVFATAAIAVLAVFLTSSTGLRGTEVQAEFEDAFPLLPGMNVRVSGAVAGTVKDIELTDNGTSLVTMVLFEGTAPPTAEASAAVRQQDITGDSYVALEPGNADEVLGDQVIATKRTLVAPRFDDLLNTFDQPTRAGLKLILVELGTALERRGDDLNEATLSLRPALEETHQALAEIESQNSALKHLIDSTDRITSQAAGRTHELGGLLESLALTLDETAAHAEGLDRGLERAPQTVSAARTTLGHLTRLATSAEPLAHTVNESAADFAQSLELLGPFLHDSSTALTDLEPTLHLTEDVLVAAEPTLEVGGKRLATAPFDLAGGIGDLFRVLLGGKDVLKTFFGADSYGHGPSLANDVGFGSVAVEAGNQLGYEDQDPHRNFLRAVGVLSCESFGLPIGPGCLGNALSATSAGASAAGQGSAERDSGGARAPEAPPSAEPAPEPTPEPGPQPPGDDSGKPPGGDGRPQLPDLPPHPGASGSQRPRRAAAGAARRRQPVGGRRSALEPSRLPLRIMRDVRKANRPGLANTITRSSSRIAQHRIALGLLVAAIGGFLAYIAWVSINGPPFQNRYELNVLVPADSPILQTGDAVRVSGRFAGFVTDVSPAPEEDALRIETELDPEFAPVGMDARSNVKVRSLVYLTYLEIFPGDRSNPMPEGGTIPVEASGSGVDLLEIVQLFDKDARDTFRELSFGLGTGLAGRGVDLNVALADFDETTENATKQLGAITEKPGTLSALISGAAATTSGLEGDRPDDVSALIGSGAAAFGAVAARRSDLGAAIDLLRPFEDEFLATAPIANPLLRDAAAFSEEVAPLTRQVADALPGVNGLLSLGDELSSETLAITKVADPVLEATAPQVKALYPVVASLIPMLDQLKPVVDAVNPYEQDIITGSRGLNEATRTQYPEGQTAPGANALRFGIVLLCATARNPYPAPGSTLENKEFCGPG